MWRQKYEIDGLAKAEELEMSRLKLQARLSESQATIEQLNAKLHQIEKSKAKTQADLNDMNVQLDQAQILNSRMLMMNPHSNWMKFVGRIRLCQMKLRIS